MFQTCPEQEGATPNPITTVLAAHGLPLLRTRILDTACGVAPFFCLSTAVWILAVVDSMYTELPAILPALYIERVYPSWVWQAHMPADPVLATKWPDLPLTGPIF